jgi:allantoicase
MCSASAGAQVLFATDEWFASANNMLQDGPPIFDPDAFCEQGKVMDGWETRRRREAGHDWCIIKLAHRAQIVGVEIDTAHFTGNNVPAISLEIADLNTHRESVMVSGIPGVVERILHGGDQGVGHTPEEVHEAEESCRRVKWKELLPASPLRQGYEPTRMHYFNVSDFGTHVRVNYFPDGGVARLRLWGTSIVAATKIIRPPYVPISTGKICTVVHHKDTNLPPSRQDYVFPELSCSSNGGVGVDCSNKHYGHPELLIQPTLGKDMGDGWETARHPERPAILKRDPKTNLVDSPLMDWAVLKLGRVAPEGIARIILDTKHFRGNYPESVQIEGCVEGKEWFPLIARTRMAADAEHVFDANLQQIENATRAVSLVRVSIYPDGGLSRVRVYGKPGDVDATE